MPIKHTNINSSMIKSIGYDKDTKTMEINFHNTGIYSFPNFPELEYNKLMNASSQGTHFATFIKNKYPAVKAKKTGGEV